MKDLFNYVKIAFFILFAALAVNLTWVAFQKEDSFSFTGKKHVMTADRFSMGGKSCIFSEVENTESKVTQYLILCD